MNKLLPLIRREFPNYEVTQAFQAALPLYYTQLQVEALEQQSLSSFELYMLYAISLDVNTQEDIAILLGVDERDLISPGASLLKNELLRQHLLPTGQRRVLSLTEKGQQVLRDQQAPPVPVARRARLHFNALTWSPMPIEDNTRSVEEMNKEGMFILPADRRERPTLGDFTVKEVAEALSSTQAFSDKQVIAILELEKLTLEYLAPVAVLLLRHQVNSDQRIVVYRNGMLHRAKSVVLQRLFDAGNLALPDDTVMLAEPGLEVPPELSADVAHLTHALVQQVSSIENIEATLTDYETLHKQTHDRSEREALEERIRQLQDELLQAHMAFERLQVDLQQHQGTFLRTEEHRGILEQALKEAREEIIIISPWINRRTCDDDLCHLITKAVKRGVRVRIGYGIKERTVQEMERNYANAGRVIGTLKSMVEHLHQGRSTYSIFAS